MRFNINNQLISTAKCINCGHEVDLTQLLNIGTPNGFNGKFVRLLIADKFAECCIKPSYMYNNQLTNP
jgi:hypothetical protein